MKRACAVSILGLLSGVAIAWQPAPPQPRWWRGNLHTHTMWAEGDQFPEMVASWYRDHGYNFVGITEHNLLGAGSKWVAVKDVNRKAKVDAYERYLARFGPAWVETRNGPDPERLEVRVKPFDEYRTLVEEPGRFLLIQGEEITDEARNGHAIHMNATNLAEAIAPRDGATVSDVIAQHLAAVRASSERTGRDVMIHLNHPNYKWGVTAEDLASAPELRFFEVWNGVTEDNDPGDASHPSTDEIWDAANTLRITKHNAPPLFGLATDDAHNYHGTNPRAMPGRAWVMVRSAYLSPQSIVRALGEGDFYASTGVTLRDIVYDRNARVLKVDIEPRDGQTFVTRFRGTRKGVGARAGETLAEVQGIHAEYRLRGDELYVRAVVTSSAAPEVPTREFPFQRAWTQPAGWR